MENFGIKNNSDNELNLKTQKVSETLNSVASNGSSFKSFIKKTEPSSERNLTSLTDGSKMKEIIDSSNSESYLERGESIYNSAGWTPSQERLPSNYEDKKNDVTSSNARTTELTERSRRHSDYNETNDTGRGLNHVSVLAHRRGDDRSNGSLADLSLVDQSGGSVVSRPQKISVKERNSLGGEVLIQSTKIPAGRFNGNDRKTQSQLDDFAVSRFNKLEEANPLHSLLGLNSNDGGLSKTNPFGMDNSQALGPKTFTNKTNDQGFRNQILIKEDPLINSRGQAGQNSHLNNKGNKVNRHGIGVGAGNNILAAKDNSLGSNPLDGQAQMLSKVIGDKSKVKINVMVSDEGKTLSSKPNSNLTTSTITSSFSNSTQIKATKLPGNIKTGSAQKGTQSNLSQAAGIQYFQGQQQNLVQASQGTNSLQTSSEGKINLISTQSSIAGSSSGDPVANSSNNLSLSDSTRQTQQSQQKGQAQENSRSHMRSFTETISEQISVKIIKAIQSGNDRIKIQLKPAELGRVDVKMEIGNDGRVLAIVSADNKDTLELLRRDSSHLQRAFEDAGMMLNSGDLTFNLRKEGEQTAKNNSDNQSDTELSVLSKDETVHPLSLIEGDNVWLNGRIDVRA